MRNFLAAFYQGRSEKVRSFPSTSPQRTKKVIKKPNDKKKSCVVELKGSFVSCCAARQDRGSFLPQSCWSSARSERLCIPSAGGRLHPCKRYCFAYMQPRPEKCFAYSAFCLAAWGFSSRWKVWIAFRNQSARKLFCTVGSYLSNMSSKTSACFESGKLFHF